MRFHWHRHHWLQHPDYFTAARPWPVRYCAACGRVEHKCFLAIKWTHAPDARPPADPEAQP